MPNGICHLAKWVMPFDRWWGSGVPVMLFSMAKRYQQMAIALNISVLLATLFFIFAGGGNPLPGGEGRARLFGLSPLGTSWGNVGLILLLIFLEYQLTYQSFPDFPRRQAVQILIVRFLLITLSILVSRAPFAMYLFYPVLLFAFFALGRRVAYGVAVVASLFVLGYATTYSSRTLLSSADINNLFVFLLGTLMVLLLANALQQEWETSHRLQRAHDELGESHAQLQAYAVQVATLAATDERNRLARDIHDSLGHHLAATSIQLEKAAAYRDRDEAKSAEALDYARRTIREALGEVRTSVRALRESEAKFDLMPALNDLIKRMNHNDLSITLTVSGDSAPYSGFAKMTLYRIIQEGLTNTHKHARASQATINLCFTPHHAALNIGDNGQGISQGKPLHLGSGNGRFGLQGIQERVALVGGTFKIDSESHKGTQLLIKIPQNNETIG